LLLTHLIGSFLALSKRSEVLQVEGVRALNWQTECSAPDLGGHDAEGAGNAKQNGVIVMLGQAVVHQEGTRAAIDVGPWVLDLACGVKALWNLLIVGLNELDQIVVVDVLVGEVELAHETRVSFAENGMTVAWHDLTTLECDIDELTNVLASPILTILGLEVEQVVEAFLVGKAMKWAGKTIHTS